MKVVSVNIAAPKIIEWKGKPEQTGIYKQPVEQIIVVENGVEDDAVIDRKYHGGADKAVYLFSEDHYTYWKELYPDLNWEFGMFGENITIKGLDEKVIRIGAILKIGDIELQVTQPRQPCYKLGIKFGTQKMLKQFLQSSHSGIYCKVLKAGKVNKDDEVELIENHCGTITVADTFSLFLVQKDNKILRKMAINEPNLAESCRKDLTK